MIGGLLFLACQSALDRGESALESGDLLLAEQAFRIAMADNPDSPEAMYGVGWTFHLAGEHAAARETFEQLCARFPSSPLGYRGLGSTMMAQGDPKAARVQFLLAVERDPDDPRATQSLALLELAEGRAEQALTLVDRSLSATPKSTELLQTRAVVLAELGRTDEAIETVAVALRHAESKRAVAAAEITRAKILVAHASSRVDADHCEGASAVLAWLAEADLALDRAEATGVHTDQRAAGRKEVRHRRAYVEDRCPTSSLGN
jgi:Flp pilus assembly protein TadD